MFEFGISNKNSFITFIFILIRRKYWNPENFRLPFFHVFTRFRMFEPDFTIFTKCFSVCRSVCDINFTAASAENLIDGIA